MEHDFLRRLVENFLVNGKSEKVVLFSRSECSTRRFVVHYSKASFDTSFMLLRSICSKYN